MDRGILDRSCSGYLAGALGIAALTLFLKLLGTHINATTVALAFLLTPKEFDLLTYFIKHSGKVLTHRTLLAALRGGNYVEQNEYLRVFVGNLRKKLEADAAEPRYIVTEPWIGYRFNPE